MRENILRAFVHLVLNLQAFWLFLFLMPETFYTTSLSAESYRVGTLTRRLGEGGGWLIVLLHNY